MTHTNNDSHPHKVKDSATPHTLYGGIEAGGTKFICTIGTANGTVHESVHIPTGSPERTMAHVIDFFQKRPAVQAIGLASFGPIDLHPTSPTYGYLLQTPKKHWNHFDIVSPLKALNVPIAVDTDVNCAAIGEHRFGAAKGLDSYLYLTIGTGIGGAYIVNNNLLRGINHLEIGHMFVPLVKGDDFPGVCLYHGRCLEGLASGPAMQGRWGVAAEQLPPSHKAWNMETEYLSFGVANLVTILLPKRIILGGGVMHNQGLIDRLRPRVVELLANYLPIDEVIHSVENYIVLPQLDELNSAIGAMYVAAHSHPSN